MIAGRHRPHRMPVIGQNHHGFYGERMLGPDGTYDVAKRVGMLDEWRAAAVTKIDGEEKCAARCTASTVVHHVGEDTPESLRSSGLRLRAYIGFVGME